MKTNNKQSPSVEEEYIDLHMKLIISVLIFLLVLIAPFFLPEHVGKLTRILAFTLGMCFAIVRIIITIGTFQRLKFLRTSRPLKSSTEVFINLLFKK